MDGKVRCPAGLAGIEKADAFGRQEDRVQSARTHGGDPHDGAILSEGQGRENSVGGSPRLYRESLPAARRDAMRVLGRKWREQRQMGTGQADRAGEQDKYRAHG